MDRDKLERDGSTLVAALEHLTGPMRGRVTWISESSAVIRADGRRISVSGESFGDAAPPDAIATLHRSADSYEIRAMDAQPIWVNGEKVATIDLEHLDTIEFGELGPLSRFRLIGGSHRPHWNLDDILSDSVAYARASRRPMPQRVATAAGQLFHRLAVDTTVMFRLAVVAALIVLAAFAYQQYRTSIRLVERVESDAVRLEGVSAAIRRARDEALSPSDLNTLREELSLQVTSNLERLEALERRSGASKRVISEAAASVAFLQGAYAMRHIESQRMLRYVVNAAGLPVMTPSGQPLLSLEGSGPVAQIQFVGTGFLLGADGALVTNRHVAQPWDSNSTPESLSVQSFEPLMSKMVAYFPGIGPAFEVTTLKVSEEADLAILSVGVSPPVAGLSAAPEPPDVGEEVIVMGYPTGLRAMLAQAGRSFVDELRNASETDFWAVAERLANAGLIAPLASRGIVGQASDTVIVYDAETTHGGSGGPVLNHLGQVVAVNTAILPEFGGSNLGVPVASLMDLVEAFRKQ